LPIPRLLWEFSSKTLTVLAKMVVAKGFFLNNETLPIDAGRISVPQPGIFFDDDC
jgi:hypothetical protein